VPHSTTDLRARLDRIQEANAFLQPGADSTRPVDVPALGLPPLLLSVVRDALGNLRRLLEDPHEAAITWRRPLVELRYPVEIDWGPVVHPPRKSPRRRTSPSRPTQLRLPLADAVPDAPLPYLGLELLASLTRRALVFREDGQEVRHAPEDPEAPSRPFTFGMIQRSALPERMGQGLDGALSADHLIPLTREVSQQLADAVDTYAPGLDFAGQRGTGEPFSGSVVGQIRPLVIDADEQVAYYPVTVGIFLRPTADTADGTTPPAAPDSSEWTTEDLLLFWEAVFRSVESAEDASPQTPQTGGNGATVETGVFLRDQPLPPPLEARPPTMPFEVAFGPVRVDNTSLAYVSNLHNLRFPKRLGDVPDLDELRQAEVERLLERLGEEAFESPRKETGDKSARGAWLKRRPAVGGGFHSQLTAEAERNLKVKEGLYGSGYRFFSRTWNREFLTRIFQVGRKGFVEVGLSWFGIAGLWTDEGQHSLQRQADELAETLAQPLLFDDMNEKQRQIVENTLRQAEIFLDGQKLMRALLVQVPKQGTTVVELSAFAVRKLLGIEGDNRWRDRVLGSIYALTECKFLVDSFQTSRKFQAYGQFLAGHDYIGAGPGKHADGVFRFYVDPRFLGCLNAYAKDKPRIESGREILEFDFGKRPARDDARAMSYSFTDAGLPWYHAEENFTPQQENLVAWIYQQRTLEGSARSRRLRAGEGSRSVPSPGSAEAREPRIYGREFCPLLPPDGAFHGALGRFKVRQNPEAGWTLKGLMPKLGYPPLPKGRAYNARATAVREVLDDFRRVIEEYLEGHMVARLDKDWLSLDAVRKALDSGRLSATRIARNATWFPFVPHDSEQIQIRKWEARLAAQAEAGSSRFAYTYTNDPEEAERSRVARIEGTSPSLQGRAPEPLRERLAAALDTRELSQEAFVDLLREHGVYDGKGARRMVSYWINGKKPIRRDLVPILEHWVETGGFPDES